MNKFLTIRQLYPHQIIIKKKLSPKGFEELYPTVWFHRASRGDDGWSWCFKSEKELNLFINWRTQKC